MRNWLGLSVKEWVAAGLITGIGILLLLGLFLVMLARANNRIRQHVNLGPGGLATLAAETAHAPLKTPLPPGMSPIAPTSTPLSVQIPPTGDRPKGKIVYACQIFRDLARDQICIMDADGSHGRRLTSDDNGDYNFPSLSPDGSSIVYVGNENGFYEIFEMPLDGAPHKLTDFAGGKPYPGNATAPAISPDGKTIAFNLKSEQHDEIWLMDRDGSNLRRVFGPPTGEGWDPTWSPDGSQILFAEGSLDNAQLYTIRPDGSGLSQVTHVGDLRGRSDWSPDGQWIATYVGESWNREIWLVRPDGTDGHAITNGGNNLAPSFSPDSQWLAFTSYKDHYKDVNGCEIYIMKMDGSRIIRLTDNNICDWQPRWGK